MKKLFLFALLTILAFVSCDKDDKIDFISNDAQIYSFSLKDVNNADSEINRINFAINQVESVIYNPHRLPNGTELNRIKLLISFNPVYNVQSIRIITSESSFIWDGTSYIDLSENPVYFEITAPSGYIKKYHIDIRRELIK